MLYTEDHPQGYYKKKSRNSLPWKESATSPLPLVGEDLGGGGKERNFLAACCSAAEVEMLGGGWTTAAAGAAAGVEVTAAGAFLTTVRGVRILRIRSHIKLQNMAIIGSGRIRIQCCGFVTFWYRFGSADRYYL
jgi:hypothetical protein